MSEWIFHDHNEHAPVLGSSGVSRTWWTLSKNEYNVELFSETLSPAVSDPFCLSLPLSPLASFASGVKQVSFVLLAWEAASGDRGHSDDHSRAPGQSSSPRGRANPFWAPPLDTVTSLLLLSETSQNYSLGFTQNTISCPKKAS